MTGLKYPAMKTTRGRRSPTGRTLWCGPFALAVVTGLEYDEAHAKAVAVEQRRLNADAKRRGLPPGYWTKAYFKGMTASELARTAEKLGVKADWHHVPNGKRKGPTLLTFSREHTVKGKTYVIIAGWHWVVVKDGVLYHSHVDPITVEEAPTYRMARVSCWAEVKPRPEAVLA